MFGSQSGIAVRCFPLHQFVSGADEAGIIFAPYESFPFDDPAAVEYGRLRGTLAIAGTPIGPNDLMIAAIELMASVGMRIIVPIPPLLEP